MHNSNLLLVLLLVAVLLPSSTYAITCYRCTVFHTTYPNINAVKQLCTEFEESSKFEVDCPYSTMCTKRVLSLKLLDGREINTYERGCASQKHTEPIFKKGNWTQKSTINEPYNEGCQQFESSTICYCRGAYCNSAPASTKEPSKFSSDAMTVLFIFNLLKYLRASEY